MIKKICDSLVKANVDEFPISTLFTQGTHVIFVPSRASFNGNSVGIHGEDTIKEHHDAHDGRW